MISRRNRYKVPAAAFLSAVLLMTGMPVSASGLTVSPSTTDPRAQGASQANAGETVTKTEKKEETAEDGTKTETVVTTETTTSGRASDGSWTITVKTTTEKTVTVKDGSRVTKTTDVATAVTRYNADNAIVETSTSTEPTKTETTEKTSGGTTTTNNGTSGGSANTGSGSTDASGGTSGRNVSGGSGSAATATNGTLRTGTKASLERAQAQSWYKNLDRNGDGHITGDEVRRISRTDAMALPRDAGSGRSILQGLSDAFQPIKLKLRARIEYGFDEGFEGDFTDLSDRFIRFDDDAQNWEYCEEDGWYYYTLETRAGEEIGFMNGVQIPDDWDRTVMNKGFTVTIVAEAAETFEGANVPDSRQVYRLVEDIAGDGSMVLEPVDPAEEPVLQILEYELDENGNLVEYRNDKTAMPGEYIPKIVKFLVGDFLYLGADGALQARQTGDIMMMGLWLLLAILAGAAVVWKWRHDRKARAV